MNTSVSWINSKCFSLKHQRQEGHYKNKRSRKHKLQICQWLSRHLLLAISCCCGNQVKGGCTCGEETTTRHPVSAPRLSYNDIGRLRGQCVCVCVCVCQWQLCQAYLCSDHYQGYPSLPSPPHTPTNALSTRVHFTCCTALMVCASQTNLLDGAIQYNEERPQEKQVIFLDGRSWVSE